MAELITIARPYAEAVFRVAQEEKAYQAWSDILAVLAHIASDTETAAVMSHPKLKQEDALHFLIEGIGSAVVTEKMKNFITVILENGRFKALPLIAEHYEALRAKLAGVTTVTIESAFAIEDSQLNKLTTQLEKHFKQKIDAKVVEHSELIGGIRVIVGDEIIDASIRGKLSRLAASLKS